MKPQEIIIESGTKKSIDLMIRNLPQSVLLHGDPGIGLMTAASYICNQIKITPTIILPEKDEKIDLDKGVVGVDIVRRLFDETRTKMGKKRVIVIDYAERMTHQAQNSFLKLLEEPNSELHFILLSHSLNDLLPTVLSRVQKINIKPISINQSQELLDSIGVSDAQKRSQVLFMALGLPAEIIRLCNDNDYFAICSQNIRDARTMINGDIYERLKVINSLKDDRIRVLRILLDMANMIKISLNKDQSIESINKIDQILEVYTKIESGGNIRLSLSRIVI